MKVTAPVLLALPSLLLSGCSSISPEVLREDLRPGGAQVRLRVPRTSTDGSIWLHGEWIEGELIALKDQALLVLVPAPSGKEAVLAEVRATAITRIETRDPPIHGLNGPPTPSLLAGLRPVCRHPQGLSSGGLQELLQSLGQTDVVRVGS